jgi:Domain of unknown function (DUF4166)
MQAKTFRKSSAIGSEAFPPSTLRRQLGAGWHNLPPATQERFAREPQPGETIIYKGSMRIIRRSFMGWLFAWLTMPVGNPLSPFAGKDVPMEVRLKKSPTGGVQWTRSYFYPGRKVFAVTSEKRESAKGEMLECVGGGFGMKLKVTAEDGCIHFRSYRYFWDVMGLRIPLPHWLAPGATHVIHTDLGQGEFMYTISMVHAQLGETFFQEGVFWQV